MLMLEDMLKVYSGQASIFSNLSLQKCYFHKFNFFSNHVYFAMISKACGGQSTEAAKDESYI